MIRINVTAGNFRNRVSPVPLRHFYAISAWAFISETPFDPNNRPAQLLHSKKQAPKVKKRAVCPVVSDTNGA